MLYVFRFSSVLTGGTFTTRNKDMKENDLHHVSALSCPFKRFSMCFLIHSKSLGVCRRLLLEILKPFTKVFCLNFLSLIFEKNHTYPFAQFETYVSLWSESLVVLGEGVVQCPSPGTARYSRRFFILFPLWRRLFTGLQAEVPYFLWKRIFLHAG